MLLSLLAALLCACQRNTVTVVPKDSTGWIELSEGIFIDTAAETLTFGEGSFVTCGDQRIDMSGTTHDISKYLDGADIYLHPSHKTLSLVPSYDNIHLGALASPLYLSELNIRSGQLYVDGIPASALGALQDKTVVCLGDSMTEGVGTTMPYYEWFPQLLGASTVTAHGLGGSCIAPKVDEIPTWETGIASFYERYETMEDDADVIIVFGGVNDWTTGRELGTSSDTGTSTFYGAMDALCDGLEQKYPDAEIFFFSSPQNNCADRPANDLAGTQWEGNTEGFNRKGYRLQDYVDAMEEVCAQHQIHFCSLTDTFPWGAAELGDNNGTAGTYGSDGLRPNADGHALIAQEMTKFIISSLSE